MAITETIQAKEFTAGAPNITLQGDLRPNQMMASGPDMTDSINELALELFGKDLRLLTEEELDILRDEAERLTQKYMASGGRAQYGLGSIVKSVGRAVKGVAKGVGKAVKGVGKGISSIAKSDLGKAALAAAALYYGGGGFGRLPGGFSMSNIPGGGFLSRMGSKGKGTLASFAIGTLGSAALSAAEAGGLDSSDPNAEVDLESLSGYLTKGYKNLNPQATDEEVFQFVQENTAEYRAMGGRIGYAMGTDEKVTMAAGIEGLPLRQNKAGVKELDLRETGGFIQPVGIKEKADDIPAMLSNNEFVFTADAVRAAGGGDIDKGAQLMYDTMKKLESKVG